jgi:hypothetical protein
MSAAGAWFVVCSVVLQAAFITVVLTLTAQVTKTSAIHSRTTSQQLEHDHMPVLQMLTLLLFSFFHSCDHVLQTLQAL